MSKFSYLLQVVIPASTLPLLWSLSHTLAILFAAVIVWGLVVDLMEDAAARQLSQQRQQDSLPAVPTHSDGNRLFVPPPLRGK